MVQTYVFVKALNHVAIALDTDASQLLDLVRSVILIVVQLRRKFLDDFCIRRKSAIQSLSSIKQDHKGKSNILGSGRLTRTINSDRWDSAASRTFLKRFLVSSSSYFSPLRLSSPTCPFTSPVFLSITKTSPASSWSNSERSGSPYPRLFCLALGLLLLFLPCTQTDVVSVRAGQGVSCTWGSTAGARTTANGCVRAQMLAARKTSIVTGTDGW